MFQHDFPGGKDKQWEKNIMPISAVEYQIDKWNNNGFHVLGVTEFRQGNSLYEEVTFVVKYSVTCDLDLVLFFSVRRKERVTAGYLGSESTTYRRA